VSEIDTGQTHSFGEYIISAIQLAKFTSSDVEIYITFSEKISEALEYSTISAPFAT
jgi:hypothetical protein